MRPTPETGSAVMSQRRWRLARAPRPGSLADSCKGDSALEVLLLRSHGNAAANANASRTPGARLPADHDPHPIILFDGECILCNRTVDFVLRHDDHKLFRFATIQSDVGSWLARHYGLPSAPMSSVYLIDRGQVYSKSQAVIGIARQLQGLRLTHFMLKHVPRFLRDFAYDIIAKHRYAWFGKQPMCRVPTKDDAERFLR